jgi:hypothetical protein
MKITKTPRDWKDVPTTAFISYKPPKQEPAPAERTDDEASSEDRTVADSVASSPLAD